MVVRDVLFFEGQFIKHKNSGEILKVECDCLTNDEICYTNKCKIKKENFDDYENTVKSELVKLNFVEISDSLIMIDKDCVLKENFIRFQVHGANDRAYSEYSKCYMTVYFKDFDDKLELVLRAECDKEFGLSKKEVEKVLLEEFLKTIQNNTEKKEKIENKDKKYEQEIIYDNLPW